MKIGARVLLVPAVAVIATLASVPLASGQGGADTIAPNTQIFRAPAHQVTRPRATFGFLADEQESAYYCKLDGGRFTLCQSPKSYRGLRPGRHTFQVGAVDLAGNVETTPARYTWTIGKRRGH